MLAVANADPALPFRIRQFLIGDILLAHPLLRGIDNPAACRQAEPFALGITQIGGDILFDDGIVENRLRDTALLGLDQTGDIDRQQHIGRRIDAFCLDAFHQSLVEKKNIRLYSRFLGKGVEQRLDQFRLAIGIDINLSLCPGFGCAGKDHHP